MITVDLDNLNGLPQNFLNDLSRCDDLFLREDWLENLLSESRIISIINEIDSFCRENYLVGYHYTRCDHATILQTGLTCRTGSGMRDIFVNTYGSHFSYEEIKIITKAWDGHFDDEEQVSRDNMIFFNFTKNGLNGHSADSLLQTFGGEQIYLPLLETSDAIVSKLKSLGKPLVLKCRLSPKNITAFGKYAFGRIATSTYHRTVNPNAHQEDRDGFQRVDIKPDDIEIIR